jgi:hypothetical protein
MQPKIKVVVGYREDQYHTIDADEAHKAYYLFEHPKERGIFANGVAIRGEDIHSIVPDWHATMGWNPTHRLDTGDWNEIRDIGAHYTVTKLMSAAHEVAKLGNMQDFNKPLTLLIEQSYPQLAAQPLQIRGGTMKPVADLIKPV